MTLDRNVRQDKVIASISDENQTTMSEDSVDIHLDRLNGLIYRKIDPYL